MLIERLSDEKELAALAEQTGEEWLDAEEARRWTAYAAVEGMRLEGTLRCAVGILPLEAPLALCDAARPVLKGRAETIVCPFGKKRFQDTALLRALEAGAKAAKPALLLRPGFAGWPQQIFQHGYCLYRVRPLCRLRPFGIFILSEKPLSAYNESINLPMSDLYALSRRLENGARGFARTVDGLLLAENDKEEKDETKR
ncbi:MAG: hypothetical protein Q4G07_06665 [Oscillospiraceae bacterium]|nr:hypothetical protein [Oscillospiraceae bacterium]